MSPPSDRPTVTTERLLLRLPQESDLDAWAAFMADEETTRFIGGVQNRVQAWRGMATVLGAWQLRGCGFFSVIERESGRWVGRVGPWYPEAWPGTEVGWGIAPEFQRRGYAVESAAASMDWAFENLGWSEIIHCIDPANTGSIAVAERLGSKLLRSGEILHPFDMEIDVWGQSRDEWAANRKALGRR